MMHHTVRFRSVSVVISGIKYERLKLEGEDVGAVLPFRSIVEKGRGRKGRKGRRKKAWKKEDEDEHESRARRRLVYYAFRFFLLANFIKRICILGYRRFPNCLPFY